MAKMGEDWEGLQTTEILNFSRWAILDVAPLNYVIALVTNLLFFFHQGAVFLQDSARNVTTSAIKKRNEVV